MNIRSGKKLKSFASAISAVVTLCLLLSCFPMLVAADNTNIVSPDTKLDGFTAFLYDNTSGLPTSEANAIAETSDGFIWIGSYGGLIRYDGNTFERCDSTTGIASVVSLFVDKEDRLWIGTNDSGAAVMDKVGNVTMYGKADGLPSSSVRDFAEDPNGDIYIATTQGIALVHQDGTLALLDDDRINDQYIRTLETGSDGITYALTMDGDIFTLTYGKVGNFYDGEDDLGVTDIHAFFTDPANPGYLYLGTKGSWLWYGSLEEGFPKKQRLNINPLAYVNSIRRLGDDLWICANNGIGVWRGGDEIEVIENIPMNSNVESVMADYQGNLWFASSRQGVMKIVPNYFTNVFERFDIPEAVVNSTCYYDGLLFIGTDSGLTVLDEDGKVASLRLNYSMTASGDSLGYLDLGAMLRDIRIRSIIKDSKDRLWFSTFSDLGLVRYDHGSVTTFGIDEGMPSKRVRAVYECSDGSFLVACTGGLAVLRGNKIEKVYGSEDGINNTELLTAVEGNSGDKIIGTDGDGIYVISDSGISHFDTSNGLASDVIMRIKKDNKRNMYWIVTSNSLAYMTSSYEIKTIRNFPFSNNFDLYENSKEEMWILSSNGIYVIKAEDLIANGSIEPVFYGIDNGLPVIATSNSYSCVTPEGVLYMAGSTGIAEVNIEKPFEAVDHIRVSVPYIDADGVKYYPDDNGVITVPHDVKKITVYPYICSHTLMNPMVSYTLVGFSTEPTTLKRTELSPIDFTNLKGGTYDFKMSISDVMGQGTTEYSITIVKQKAIYEYAWFFILVGLGVILVIALAVYLYVRKKTKSLLKKQEENRILIREIVEAFAKTIDMKDNYTNGHSKRVAEYTAMLTRELGYNEETVEKYYNIALLHDIGKIGVPAQVLNKPGKLDDDEFKTIKSHTVLGYNVLKDISIMPELSVGAEAHHERPDGKGYPNGLKGDEIPRVAQIIGVADAFDAMYSNRPYRNRMNFEKVVSIIRGASGTQLTADVVDAFLRIVERGGFRDPEDHGGGTTEDIDNIHKRFDKEQKEKEKEESKEGSREADKKEADKAEVKEENKEVSTEENSEQVKVENKVADKEEKKEPDKNESKD